MTDTDLADFKAGKLRRNPIQSNPIILRTHMSNSLVLFNLPQEDAGRFTIESVHQLDHRFLLFHDHETDGRYGALVGDGWSDAPQAFIFFPADGYVWSLNADGTKNQILGRFHVQRDKPSKWILRWQEELGTKNIEIEERLRRLPAWKQLVEIEMAASVAYYNFATLEKQAV